jgi:hypothetical protein
MAKRKATRKIVKSKAKPLLPTTWTTREGDVLDIKGMTTEHIVNCVNLLKKQQDFYVGDWSCNWTDWDEDDDGVMAAAVAISTEPKIQAFINELRRRIAANEDVLKNIVLDSKTPTPCSNCGYCSHCCICNCLS